MKLKQVTVKKYKCFLTEQTVAIEDGATRLVGKNESGKTAFLEALAKYNYFDDEDKKFVFDKTHDYPRNELKSYEQQNPENSLEVVTCVFAIDSALIAEIQSDVGQNTFSQETITISHKYSGSKTYHVKSNTQAIGNNLKSKYMDKAFIGFNDIVGGYIAKQYISPNIPQFWYFDEYYALPAQISLTKFNNKAIDASFTKEQFDIATALFSLSGVDVSKLLTDKNHEAFISELEATSNSITDKFLEYWSTNKNLEIQFEIQTVANDKLLNIRIRNTKHRVTLPLRNRSKGFVWFFSFLVWFSRIENKDNIVILLDEPGLNLHADAQNDLLNY